MTFSLRIGFNYAKGLQRTASDALVNARMRDGAFRSIDELTLRVPELNRKDLVSLAQIGALNSIGEVEHRRDALWQVEEAAAPLAHCCAETGTRKMKRATDPAKKDE